MFYNNLGNTQLMVSKLCFGTLSIGPLQANLSIEDGTAVISHAVESGINFFDTAELYKTYGFLKEAVKKYGREKFIISTKCYAYDEATAEKSLAKALKEIDTDYIDIFSLHEQESEHTLRGHSEALNYFCKKKKEGIVRAIGISTHHVAAVKAAIRMNDIEVIHPILNCRGFGIQDGTLEEMIEAIKEAYTAGKGIYAMKILGGGNLINISDECFNFILNFPYIHSAAVGMKSIQEVTANILRFQNKPVPAELLKKISNAKRRLIIDFWCQNCGECIKHCSHNALEKGKQKVHVIDEKCVLCGYCGAWCPNLCIKII